MELLWLHVISVIYLAHVQGERFVQEPVNTSAIRGQSVVLRCTVQDLVGLPQWLRDGFGLGPGPTFDGYPRYTIDRNSYGQYNLNISDAQLEDDATFQCQVGATSSTQGLQSRNAKLAIYVPPSSVTIDEGPVAQVVAGSIINLTCHAPGCRPAATITWFRDDDVTVGDADVISGHRTDSDGKLQSVTSVLTVRPTGSDNGKTYSCRANNSATVVPPVARVQLNVVYSPQVSLTMTPSDKLKEFDDVTFLCTADANPPVSRWIWYSGNAVIPNETGNKLVISNIDRKLNGNNITCQATNAVGSGQHSVTVSLNYGPQFTPDPVDASTDLDASSVNLTCLVDSRPPASIVWTRPDSPQSILLRSSVLTISPVTADSFGSYTCTASVVGYGPVSRKVRLLMNGAPTVQLSPSEQHARPGDTVRLDCRVVARPKASFIGWSLNDENIDPNQQTRYNITATDLEDGQLSTLTIAHLSDDDFGTFNCSTANSYGTASMTIELSPAGVPSAVPYILAGVFSGVFVIVLTVIIVIVIVYFRRKSRSSESGSDNSDAQMVRSSSDSASSDSKAEVSSNSGLSPSTSYDRPSLDLYRPDVIGGSYRVSSVSRPDCLRHYDNVGRQFHPTGVPFNPYSRNTPLSPSNLSNGPPPSVVQFQRAVSFQRPYTSPHMTGEVQQTSSVRNDVTSAQTVASSPSVGIGNSTSRLATNV